MSTSIEWDPLKAVLNHRKHGVSFVEAALVLEDPLGRTMPDDHVDEPRFVTVGESDRGRCLVVVWTPRRGTIRIISARPATRSERRDYEGEDHA